jgi:hypothetical protein
MMTMGLGNNTLGK